MRKTHVLKILLVVMLLLTSMSGVLADNYVRDQIASGEDPVDASLEALGLVFTTLFSGDVGGALDYLLDTIPFFAVFLAIYALFWYLGEITLFKGAQQQKFAHMFAAGLSLAAVWQGTVFNFVLRFLGGAFTTVIIIMLAIFMFLIAMRRMQTNHARTGADMFAAKGDQFKEKAAYKADKRKFNQAMTGLSSDAGDAVRTGRRTLSDILRGIKDEKQVERDDSKLNKLLSAEEKTEEAVKGMTAELTSVGEKINSLVTQLENLISSSDPGASQRIVEELKRLAPLLEEGQKDVKALINRVAELAQDSKKGQKLTMDEIVKLKKELADQQKIAAESTDENLKNIVRSIETLVQQLEQEAQQEEQVEHEEEQVEQQEENDLALLQKDFIALATEARHMFADPKPMNDPAFRSEVESLLHRSRDLRNKIGRLNQEEQQVTALIHQHQQMRNKMAMQIKQLRAKEQAEEHEEQHEEHAERNLAADVQRLTNEIRVFASLNPTKDGDRIRKMDTELHLAYEKLLRDVKMEPPGTARTRLMQDAQGLKRQLDFARQQHAQMGMKR